MLWGEGEMYEEEDGKQFKDKHLDIEALLWSAIILVAIVIVGITGIWSLIR